MRTFPDSQGQPKACNDTDPTADGGNLIFEEVLTNLESCYGMEFKGIVGNLSKEIARFKLGGERHPSFMGEGRASEVFSLEVEEQLLAVRFVRSSAFSARVYAESLVRAIDVPGAEQIVAFSDEDNVTISRALPGYVLGKGVPLEIMQSVTTEQVAGLIETAALLCNRGLSIDGEGHNILFDPDQGFSLIDFDVFDVSGPGAIPAEQAVESAVFYVIDDFTASHVKLSDGSTESEFLEAGIELVKKFEESLRDEHGTAWPRAIAGQLKHRRTFYEHRLHALNRNSFDFHE